jgi:hypothetical membrane protein
MTDQDSRRRRVAGAALFASGSIFFAAEFIAAAAWTHPAYSYTYHFISDLGVHGPSTAFSQYMYSPLFWVMNTGFVAFGLTALAGVILLAGLTQAPGRRHRGTIALAAVLAVGSTLVGLFPGSAEAIENGTVAFHSFGALAAFVSGNALVIRIGRRQEPLGIPRALRRPLVTLGIVGLVSMVGYMVMLGAQAPNLVGLVERGAVYPVLIGLMAVGAGLWSTPSAAPRPGIL